MAKLYVVSAAAETLQKGLSYIYLLFLFFFFNLTSKYVLVTVVENIFKQFNAIPKWLLWFQ